MIPVMTKMIFMMVVVASRGLGGYTVAIYEGGDILSFYHESTRNMVVLGAFEKAVLFSFRLRTIS